MVIIFAKSPGTRTPRRSKHFLEDRVGSKRISPAAASPVESAVEYPLEPQEVDQPVRCPPPELSIMQDGRIWKQRLIESLRRRNDRLLASKERNYVVPRVGSTPTRPRAHSGSFEKFLFVAHSAPEYELQKLLE